MQSTEQVVAGPIKERWEVWGGVVTKYILRPSCQMGFFRGDALLRTLYPAIHSRPKYIRDFFPPLPNLIEIGGRRGENDI